MIIIGSLFWETENNAINDADSKSLAKKREEWRETYLNLNAKKIHNLPIRYGRTSSSRKCTYTMVFSSLALNENSFGIIVPYKNEIDFSNYLHFERQAKILADVEGISKGENRLRKSWGCIGIYINPNSNHSEFIKKHWDNLKMTDREYSTKFAKHYRFSDLTEDISLLKDDYSLTDEVKIDTEIDFLFLTYIRAKHRNENINNYPTPKEIAEEINRSDYKTYFEENINNQITTFQDEDIKTFLK